MMTKKTTPRITSEAGSTRLPRALPDCPSCGDAAQCKAARPFLEQCHAMCARVEAAREAGRLTFDWPEKVARKMVERWGFTPESLAEYLAKWSPHGMKPPRWWQPGLGIATAGPHEGAT
jgi:hypothetical protein